MLVILIETMLLMMTPMTTQYDYQHDGYHTAGAGAVDDIDGDDNVIDDYDCEATSTIAMFIAMMMLATLLNDK